jgi:hypothetical protein
VSCPEEWESFEDALIRFVEEYTRHERLYHQCEFHKDTESCHVAESLGMKLSEYMKELRDSITDLSRCLERSIGRRWVTPR